MKLMLSVVWFSILFAGAHIYAQSPCETCVSASTEALKRCLDNAISQEDKISCADKQDAQAKVCEQGECKTERAQGAKRGEDQPEKKPNSDR